MKADSSAVFESAGFDLHVIDPLLTWFWELSSLWNPSSKFWCKQFDFPANCLSNSDHTSAGVVKVSTCSLIIGSILLNIHTSTLLLIFLVAVSTSLVSLSESTSKHSYPWELRINLQWRVQLTLRLECVSENIRSHHLRLLHQFAKYFIKFFHVIYWFLSTSFSHEQQIQYLAEKNNNQELAPPWYRKQASRSRSPASTQLFSPPPASNQASTRTLQELVAQSSCWQRLWPQPLPQSCFYSGWLRLLYKDGDDYGVSTTSAPNQSTKTRWTR